MTYEMTDAELDDIERRLDAVGGCVSGAEIDALVAEVRRLRGRVAPPVPRLRPPPTRIPGDGVPRREPSDVHWAIAAITIAVCVAVAIVVAFSRRP